MSRQEPHKFIDQLTITRFIAAVLVFLFHFARDFSPFDNQYLKNFIHASNIAVPYFFLLSGFILTYVYYNRSKPSFSKFWVARLSRIYPLYFCALCLDTIFKSRFWDNYNVNWSDFFLNTLLIQSWFSEKQLTCNGPGWSLSVELFLYITFPFLLLFLLKKHSVKTILTTCLVVWFITQLIHIPAVNMFAENKLWISIFRYNPLAHLSTFLLGCISAILFLKSYSLVEKYSLIFISLPVFILIYLMFFDNPLIQYHHSGLFSPLLSMFIIGLASNKGSISLFLAERPFVYLGEISFGIYILQYPALFFTKYLHDVFSFPNWSVLFMYYHFIVLVLLSIFLYHIVEIPFKNVIRKIIVTANVN